MEDNLKGSLFGNKCIEAALFVVRKDAHLMHEHNHVVKNEKPEDFS